jgi:transcriptional regulator with XRE-family HTH domain
MKKENSPMTTQTESFGQLFKSERVKLKKTLREVGDYVGKSVSYLSDVEHGRKGAPDLETVRKIEEFFLITDGRLVKVASAERWRIPRSIMQQAKRRAVADFLLRADEITDDDIDEFLSQKLNKQG